MKSQPMIGTCIGLALLVASASFAQRIKTDYDRGADFDRYGSYSWAQVQTQDPLMADRIKSAVNGSLAAKGWTEVPSGGTASLVASEMTREKQTLDTIYNGFGGWRWGGVGDAMTTTETYQVGTLVVDIFDSSTKKLIWRGILSDALSKNSGKNIKNLDKGVAKMFEHFPPDALKTK